ncbi:MAG: FadR/GntR family transcriptional regulator [Burkholderiaceae bacterium]
MKLAEPQRLYRRIAERIRGGVLRGEWPVGTRLPPERDLSLALGVSRPSLREALIALEVEGIVEVRTGSGVYVRAAHTAGNLSASANSDVDWGPLEVMRARQVIEVEVAAMAAANARKSEIALMHESLQMMREEAANGEVPRHGDEAFHLAVARACGNDVLFDMVQRTWMARDGALFERLGDYFENPPAWKKAIDEHEVVLRAIEVHDVSGARRAMQTHLRNATKRYSASWKLPAA